MRYLLLLLLFPSLSYAGQCPAGFGVGNNVITAPTMICIPFSASPIGGCLAYCGGSAGGSVCVEFPNASPPSKGPYVTSGSPCGYDGESPGNGNSTGSNPGSDGGDYVGRMVVGPDVITDIGLGFNSVSKNVVTGSNSIKAAIDTFSNKLISKIDSNSDKYMQFIVSDIARIAQNTSGMSEGGASTVDFEMAGYLKSIYDQTVADSARTEAYRSSYFDLIEGFRHDVSRFPDAGSGNGNGNGTTAADWQNLRNSLNSLDSWERINSHELSQMQMYLSGISSSSNYIASLLQDSIKGPDVDGDGVGDGVPDKPCEGPLCSFTPPSGSGSSSGFSSVFDDKSIADVKSKIEDKNKAITDKMQDIKSVFKQSDIQITGSYDNDYKNIMGADIDLSGKSNWELFFNSGPKVALWLLALLIAFGILMGGRKNA